MTDIHSELMGLIQRAPYIGCADTDRQYAVNWLMNNGVTVQKWISVKDRLPTREDANETESILAINKDENYVGRWIWDIVARWPSEFTYWMPRPEPPKEVE